VKLRLKPIRHAQLTTRRFEAKLHWQAAEKRSPRQVSKKASEQVGLIP
jgi:hypothetical protein